MGMERIDRDLAREILDMELKIAFQGNDRDTAWVLLRYAEAIDVISREEYKYLCKAIRYLD